MIVLHKKPLALAEAESLVDNLDEREILKAYFKEFKSLDLKKSNELIEELRALDNPKFKEEHFAKLADFVPKDVEDVNKIFNDVSLSEDEANKIIEIVGKY